MPNTKSAAKRLRQNKKKHKKNKAIKSSIKTHVKKFRELVKNGKEEKAQQLIRDIEKMVDKAASKGVIHKNKANRIKSRLMKLLS